MPTSRIGPFALEAPLSDPSSSGQVFRAIHLEQRKLAALRVFKVPMGMTPESRRAFAVQLDQLKQLRHLGIVRCYGGGFDTRSAFLAYELVDGESLDHLLTRRDRLQWETVFDYGQQLAKALEYAHHAGWTHGRIKPDKIIIASGSVVKISDWRREAIASTIGGRPSLSQLQYAAPEILQGEEPDSKSDLYSLGVLMYAMLTGGPPFVAGDVAQLKELVCNQLPPKVSATVLDCPIWLSAIVDQLLHKNPGQRPFSATALLLALKEAERRQSEGAGVLQHAAAGFSPLQLGVDRDEAEKVLGIKPKKRRKPQSESPFYEQAWFLAAGLLVAIAAVVWLLLPPSEATLRARAERLLPPSSSQWMDWNVARDDHLQPLVRRFPEGTNAEWATERIAWINARECERRLEREDQRNRRSDWTDAERQYWQAKEFEQFGDLLSATDKYRAVIALYGQIDAAQDIVYLSSEALGRIRKNARLRSPLQDFVARKLQEAEQAYAAARIIDARIIWESIESLYAGNPDLAVQVAEATRRLDETKSSNRR